MAGEQDEGSSGRSGGTGLSLNVRIMLGMGLGVGLGVLLNALRARVFIEEGTGQWLIDDVMVEGILYVGGAIFMASLKLLVVPLVFVSLVCGTAALDDIARLGRIGGKTLGLYLLTTAVAIGFALTASTLIQPGTGLELETSREFVASEAPGLAQTVIDIFPTNPIKAMADGKMLQVIVFAALFGFAMTLSGAPGKRLLSVFDDANEVILRLVTVMMNLAPYGVFCLLAKVFAELGLEPFEGLVLYFFTVLGVLFFHALVTYPTLLTVLAGLNPLIFLRKMRAALSFAFSTASSAATIPVTLETVEEKLGVKGTVASFTVPLGATINMDGTAIMQGVATGFIAQVYGVELTGGDYLMVVLTATLASIGTAGVPGVGLIMLAMVLQQVNLPVEGIALIIGVDRLLDMVRTAVNITGDATVSCIVGKTEGELDEAIYAAPE